MATKTITIDLDAYRRLKRLKKQNESFSQLIKRVVPPPLDVAAWFQSIDDHPLGESAAAAIRERIMARSLKSRSAEPD